ncbi:murein hydrolase activator NlpD [Mixta calida]|uniref:murein hydrolase activator NlpD n=1 Tax=Mixta calida TaxID=665913 RepID=UPI0028A65C11|nr:murein hydrolase activator NlpD [Mixta calida]
MSMGSPLFTLSRVAAVSLIGFWLAGCTSDDNTQAPISTVGSQSQSGGGGMLTSGGGMTNGSVPSRPVFSSSANSSNANVTTQNGRIVYNRSYENIPKGSYSGDTYTVKRGDTLFYIAWITGNDFRDLAQRNNIAAPYNLNVGQALQVGNGSGSPITGGNAITVADATQGGVPNSPGSAQIKTSTVAQQPVITYSDDSGKSGGGKMLPSTGTTTVATTTAPVTAPPTVSSTTSSSTPVAGWRWPTDGKIIDNFSAAEGGNKGIDIAGSRGQPVIATASGRVVYAGNALRGYGNLIIIKHNDDYLSAYAHNDTMLVREQQEVKAGQKIATMGSTGTSSVRLHFEIRYKGKSVNPLRYLPQR